MNIASTKTLTAGLITTCWASLNINQLSLAARSLQCRTLYIYILYLLYSFGKLFWCKKCWTSLRVSDNMKFVGKHLQSPASPPVFAGLLISTYFNVGPKVPLDRILWKDQRCAVQRRWVHRVWIKIGSRQNWAAFDGLIMFLYSMRKPEPKMMNICDCMGVLSISGCDQDWA